MINIISEKIKIVLLKKNMSTSQLAALLEVTPQNLYNKFKRDNFSEKELKEIAAALNIEFEINFILDNGEKI